MRWRTAYDLVTDARAAGIQEVTRSGSGIAPEPAIVGTDEWCELVGSDELPLHVSEGVIEEVLWSGHGDFPEFVMRTTDGATNRRERHGDHTLYVNGLAGRVMWIEQRLSQPDPILGDRLDVVVRVDVEESDRRSVMDGRPRPSAR